MALTNWWPPIRPRAEDLRPLLIKRLEAPEMDPVCIKDIFSQRHGSDAARATPKEDGMTCLHPHPREPRIHDWESHQDIVVVCRDCACVLEIRFNSKSGKTPGGLPQSPQEARLETIY